LELPPYSAPLERRKRPGPPKRPKPDDIASHGQRLAGEAQALATDLVERREEAPPFIDPKLVFKLDLEPGGRLGESELSALGLRLLALEGNQAIVVFPDDAQLHKLQEHVSAYAAGPTDRPKYAYVGSIRR